MSSFSTANPSVSASELRTFLPSSEFQVDLHVFDRLDSTNTYAKELARGGCCGDALVVAGAQSAGRGRMGRSFYSPDGTGVYFSILHPTEKALSEAVFVTAMTAVAVRRAILRLTGRSLGIKWVNDLYRDGKKVCGILAESVCDPQGRTCLIIGIGVNWYAGSFPKELSEIAGSVEAPPTVSRSALVAEIYREWKRLSVSENAPWLSEYREHSTVLGKRIVWTENGQRFFGTAVDIDPRGALSVLTESGERVTLFSGEISVRIDPV